ncbi:MAG: RidA family protein [Candidatus Dormibacteraceae bacterium]
MGLSLPEPPAALASYVPVRSVPLAAGRSLLHVSGQVPLDGGRPIHRGAVPDQVTIEQAQEAARLCALNILAQVEAAAGLGRVEQVVQLTGFVLSSAGFGQQPLVVNAASDLLVQVLGEAGRHSRIAVGTSALPLDCPVEIAAVVQVGSG